MMIAMVRFPLSPAEIERGERLGAFLRHARCNRSMVDVAQAAGISPETLRKIETGRVATPSFATIGAISTALGLSRDQVWTSIGEDACSEPSASPESLNPV